MPGGAQRGPVARLAGGERKWVGSGGLARAYSNERRRTIKQKGDEKNGKEAMAEAGTDRSGSKQAGGGGVDRMQVRCQKQGKPRPGPQSKRLFR